jgi:hypothetical protein
MTTTDLIYEALRNFRREIIGDLKAYVRKIVREEIKAHMPQPSATGSLDLTEPAPPTRAYVGTGPTPHFITKPEKPRRKIEVKCRIC